MHRAWLVDDLCFPIDLVDALMRSMLPALVTLSALPSRQQVEEAEPCATCKRPTILPCERRGPPFVGDG